MADVDFYAVLGVSPSAEAEVIDAAYRALARKYHPDVNRAPDAAERIRSLNEAYRVLRDATARAAYDARLPRPERGPASEVERLDRPVRRPDRPVDLFAAAVGDAWRRTRVSRRRASASRRSAGAGAKGVTGGTRASRRVAWGLPLAGLAAGLFAGALGRPYLTASETRALRTYWSAAATARSIPEASRLRLLASPGMAEGMSGWPLVIGNTAFGTLATQLIADLEQASVRLRGTGHVPRAAEAYHFLQLDDWREERELRIAQRDAVVSRSQDLWLLATERGLVWRSSAQHQRAEAAAWQLAALSA